MTPAEFDYFNWRIDNIQRMLVDLAERLGQVDFVINANQFHNDEVVPAATALIETDKAKTDDGN